MPSIIQPWVEQLTLPHQASLLLALRYPDQPTEGSHVDSLIRWLRRCILISNPNDPIKTNPIEKRGGYLTGPSINPPTILGDKFFIQNESDRIKSLRWEKLDQYWEELVFESGLVNNFIRSSGYLSLHYNLRLLDAIGTLGYKHPNKKIRDWWSDVYQLLASHFQLLPESESQMEMRLGRDSSFD